MWKTGVPSAAFVLDPVRREDILYCLDAARLSPSSLNCQPWRFVVLDDPQLKNRAASYISNPLLKSNLHARQAPVLIAVVSDLSENPNPLYRTAVKKFGMYQYDLGAAVAGPSVWRLRIWDSEAAS